MWETIDSSIWKNDGLILGTGIREKSRGLGGLHVIERTKGCRKKSFIAAKRLRVCQKNIFVKERSAICEKIGRGKKGERDHGASQNTIFIRRAAEKGNGIGGLGCLEGDLKRECGKRNGSSRSRMMGRRKQIRGELLRPSGGGGGPGEGAQSAPLIH